MRTATTTLLWAALASCGDGGPHDECKPLQEKCEGDVMYHCAPDVEAIQRGVHVYVWQELLVCEDDEVFGPATCVETRLPGGRVEAACEYEDAPE